MRYFQIQHHGKCNRNLWNLYNKSKRQTNSIEIRTCKTKKNSMENHEKQSCDTHEEYKKCTKKAWDTLDTGWKKTSMVTRNFFTEH